MSGTQVRCNRSRLFYMTRLANGQKPITGHLWAFWRYRYLRHISPLAGVSVFRVAGTSQAKRACAGNFGGWPVYILCLACCAGRATAAHKKSPA